MSFNIDSDGIARVTIDGGGALNILTSSMAIELTSAIRQISKEPMLRGIVLRGSGSRAFIGGADIKEMAGLDPSGARSLITRLRDLLESVRLAPVPVIASINGWCLGAGLELAALCDIRIASKDSQFGMPEVLLGMPSVLHASVLSSHVGEGRSRWMLLTGSIVNADDAEKWGLLHQVVDADDLEAATEKAVSQILTCGPNGIRLQKALITYWEERRLDLSLDHSTAIFGRAYEVDEPRRYIEAFMERSKMNKRSS